MVDTNPNTKEYWDNIWSNQKRYGYGKVFQDIFMSKICGKLLDVGCGVTEAQTTISNQVGIEYYGLDISSQIIGKFKGTPIVHHIKVGNVLPFPDNFFDTITATDVVEHLDWEDAVFLFIEMKRVLKPTGNIFIETPDYNFKCSEHMIFFKNEDIFKLIKDFRISYFSNIENKYLIHLRRME